MKNKFYSKKFFVFMVTFGASVWLCAIGKISDQWFSITTLTQTMIYLFVEGVLDVKRIKIDTPILKTDGGQKPQKGISSGGTAGDP